MGMDIDRKSEFKTFEGARSYSTYGELKAARIKPIKR
jgi:hypothetical protein